MLQSAEVIEVFLTDDIANYYTIRFKFLNRPGNNDENTNPAFPLNAHVKSIPVPGEIVLIVTAASSFAGNFRLNDGIFYYMNDVNVQSNINYNGVPTSGKVPVSNTTSYQNASFGVVSSPNQSQPERVKKTFKPLDGQNSLQLFEGDTVMEGRSGNSIRLSSTINGLTGITKQPTWTLGDPGDPIMIISNTKKNSSSKGFRIEDINKDDSSIYLTSTQRIPLKLAGPTTVTNTKIGTFTQDLSGKQIIMSSDRIVLNAKEKELAISSKNGISITSKGDIVIEGSKDITFNANLVNLTPVPLYFAVNGEPLNKILTQILIALTAIDKVTNAPGANTLSISTAQSFLSSLLSSTVKL